MLHRMPLKLASSGSNTTHGGYLFTIRSGHHLPTKSTIATNARQLGSMKHNTTVFPIDKTHPDYYLR